MLKFYHKVGCPICKVTQMKLDKKHIEYEDVLVTPEDGDDTNFKMLCDAGIKQMPVLITDDGTIIAGPEAPKWINTIEGGAQ